MSYKVELFEKKNPLIQLEAIKSSIKDLFSNLLDETKGFKYQPSKHLSVFKTSWRHLQQVFNVTIFRIPRRLEDVLKTSRETSCKMKSCYAEELFKMTWRHILKTFWRHVLKTSWRHVLRTSWRHVLKTSSRRLGNKQYVRISVSNKCKANPKCIN